ncbi:hypothetical protein K9L97_04410 [Candidatus Woesearchaeota archaeon]|nr:hypothetical protein [Candidatus Woesearchaeota archaeon]
MMHPTESKVLQFFAKNPGRDISTSELVMHIFPVDYEECQKYIDNETNDSELLRIGKRKKARMHRKLLYHLNKLEVDKILIVTKVEGKGEKFFCLNSDFESKNKRSKELAGIVNSVSNLEQDNALLSGIEEFEEKRIVKRFDNKNWVNKINAILLRSDLESDCKDLYSVMVDLYPSFNDVLALDGFEYVVDNCSVQDLTSFIKKLELDTKDYNKYFNLLIDITKIKDSVKLTDFMIAFAQLASNNIFVIFKTDVKSISNHVRFFRQLIVAFSESKVRVNIQNLELQKSPYVLGRAGTYVISDDEWDAHVKNYYEDTVGLCFSETSLCVDFYRFFKEYKNASVLLDFLLRASKSLLLATTAMRRRSDLLFATLNRLNGKYQSKFFSYSYNYVRLWNYDVALESSSKFMLEFDEFIDLLGSIKDEVDEFCKSEETVFKSCGIPIRFKIALSSAFSRFDRDFLSKRVYSKITIKCIGDFNDASLRENLRRREELLKIFDGGDRIRFFRAPNFKTDEVLDEIKHILTNYNLPLFAYDFKERKGEVTLDNFM